MDNKSAAKYLKDHFNPDYPSSSGIQHDEAVNTAIRVLEEDTWKEVTEDSPPPDTPVLLCIKEENNYSMIVTKRSTTDYWVHIGKNIIGELKWHSLPPVW